MMMYHSIGTFASEVRKADLEAWFLDLAKIINFWALPIPADLQISRSQFHRHHQLPPWVPTLLLGTDASPATLFLRSKPRGK